MKEVIELFYKIKNTSSLNDKKKIITNNKDNKMFKKCLRFLLDGNIVTGISDKKLKKKVPSVKGFAKDFECLMEYIEKNNSGKDTDIAIVQDFINRRADEYQEFYEEMVTKKFKLGADAKLVNKCIPNLIPTFDVMLGTSIEKCSLKENEKIFITRKLNGARCAFIGNKCMTRQGKEYTGLEHIIKDLTTLGLSNMFVDGELLYKNEEGLTDSEAFQKGTGIAMSKDTDKSCLKFVIFDIFPLEEFWNGQSKETYSVRRRELNEIHKQIITNNIINIDVVQCLYSGTEHEMIWKWLDHAEKVDWEGVMLNLDTKYECKRTKNLIKVKKFFNYDLEIVGYEEGTGRNKGRLGAFIVKYNDNTVNVGSGYSDSERENFWKNREEYIGRVIEVKYKEKTTDKKTGLESLQFPVYVGMREIGKEPSLN